jgi:hypothetical protein
MKEIVDVKNGVNPVDFHPSKTSEFNDEPVSMLKRNTEKTIDMTVAFNSARPTSMS